MKLKNKRENFDILIECVNFSEVVSVDWTTERHDCMQYACCVNNLSSIQKKHSSLVY